MSSNNNEKNKDTNQKKPSISTGNPLVDIGLTVVVAIGSWAAATVTHRVSELHTRKKAKDLAVTENNQNLENEGK